MPSHAPKNHHTEALHRPERTSGDTTGLTPTTPPLQTTLKTAGNQAATTEDADTGTAAMTAMTSVPHC